MPDEIDEEIRKVLREPLKAMPGIIRSGLFKPGASSSYRLGWPALPLNSSTSLPLLKFRLSFAAEYLLFISNKMA
jgi:hypothetical protein